MEKGEGNNNGDLYAVLGLNSKCSQAELRKAYKNLAMKWHPDRFSVSGNSAFAGEANKKFQAIQRAYSVLSDANKRLLYDVGAYDSDDDDIGMGDFLGEMVAMMDQSKPKGDESLEELQELFKELFQDDFEPNGSCSASSSYASCGGRSSMPSNRNNSSLRNSRVDGSRNFHTEADGQPTRFHGGERNRWRKQKSSH